MEEEGKKRRGRDSGENTQTHQDQKEQETMWPRGREEWVLKERQAPYGREAEWEEAGGPDGREEEWEEAGGPENEAGGTEYVQTVGEFVFLCQEAQAKYEYRDGWMYDMAGGSPDHAFIIGNIQGQIWQGLRESGGGCRLYSSDLMVHVWQDDCILYPDVTVLCGERELSHNTPLAVTNPRLIVEVMSPSTEDRDRGEKFESYKLLPSFKEYLLVSQDMYRVERYTRKRNGDWKRTVYGLREEVVELKTLGIFIPMKDIYDGVEGLENYWLYTG